MVDVLTAKSRSYNMSRISSEKTVPENILKELLVLENIKGFSTHQKSIFGKPDFYFPKQKLAIFVDGCFWHGCGSCFKMPATNTDFWNSKISSNIARDRKVTKVLNKQAIISLRVPEHDIKKNPQKVLKNIKMKLQGNNHPKVLDLFAGGGGLSEGFIRAGYEIIGHIEMDKDSCDTLKTRMVYHALLKQGKYQEYINYILGNISRDELIDKYGLQKESNSVMCAEIDGKNYKELIDQVKKNLGGSDLDIIVGGPPCQAYSHIGRARDDRRMRRDKRNYLYRYYVEFLKALKPKLFVFENVPGILSAGGGRYLNDMKVLMRRAGYDVGHSILNTVDFGVPQSRKRIILIGWKKSLNKKYPAFSKIYREYTVKDFLYDLPKLKAGEGILVNKNFEPRNHLLKKLGIVDKKFNILLDHVARPHNGRDLEIYRRAVTLKNAGKVIKYDELPNRLKTHKNEKAFLDRFKVVNGSSCGAHTVVAHIAKDGHYYIHPDLKQNRSLTVREAARLQTFSDDYKFEGSRSSQFRQIGNAVPPLFSHIIAKELKSFII